MTIVICNKQYWKIIQCFSLIIDYHAMSMSWEQGVPSSLSVNLYVMVFLTFIYFIIVFYYQSLTNLLVIDQKLQVHIWLESHQRLGDNCLDVQSQAHLQHVVLYHHIVPQPITKTFVHLKKSSIYFTKKMEYKHFSSNITKITFFPFLQDIYFKLGNNYCSLKLKKPFICLIFYAINLISNTIMYVVKSFL